MALTIPGMPCALCGEPIDDPERDAFCLTKWGILDRRFAVLDDSACHQTCVDQWDLRDEFIDYFNQNCRNELYVDRDGHVAYRFDWQTWRIGIFADVIAILFCMPSLVLLELNSNNRGAQIVLFAVPYLLLAALVASCTVLWSFSLAWQVGVIVWIIVSILAYFWG